MADLEQKQSRRAAKRLDSAVRREAAKSGLRAVKSRQAIGLDNAGGYMLVDGDTGSPVAGFRYDLEADAAVEFAREYRQNEPDDARSLRPVR